MIGFNKIENRFWSAIPFHLLSSLPEWLRSLNQIDVFIILSFDQQGAKVLLNMANSNNLGVAPYAELALHSYLSILAPASLESFAIARRGLLH